MQFLVDLLLILALIAVNGLLSLGEFALVSANRARLLVLERNGFAGAALARRMSDDPQLFLPTVQVGITLVGILSGVFGGAHLAASLLPLLEEAAWLRPFAGTVALAAVVVGITGLTMVLGELVPKQLALRNPERLAALAAPALAMLARLALPVVWLLARASDLVLLLFGARGAAPQTVTEEELKALLAEGAETGVIESGEREMIERVLRLADKPVRAVMTPRADIAWVDRTDPPAEIAAALRATRHSRVVVCDGRIDNVVGVVQTKDILDSMLDGRPLSIAAALRQPMVMPDAVTALDALERLKADPRGLALVLDEYGSFEGVVTAADLLQAIVGDPVPPAAPAGAAPAEGTLALEGAMPVDELKARLELPGLPAEGSYHTLGGLILALLRRVPQAGDRIVFAGWLFEVAEMDGRRVEWVRATREGADMA